MNFRGQKCPFRGIPGWGFCWQTFLGWESLNPYLCHPFYLALIFVTAQIMIK